VHSVRIELSLVEKSLDEYADAGSLHIEKVGPATPCQARFDHIRTPHELHSRSEVRGPDSRGATLPSPPLLQHRRRGKGERSRLAERAFSETKKNRVVPKDSTPSLQREKSTQELDWELSSALQPDYPLVVFAAYATSLRLRVSRLAACSSITSVDFTDNS